MPTSKPESPDRRAFLTQLATGSAALAAGGLATHFSASDALAETPDSADPFSEAWLGKINGKHKQFFDAITVNEGFALGFAMNFLNSNNDAYKIPDNNLSAVVGLRHFAIPIAFNDDIWNRYKLGEFGKLHDPATKAPSMRNFFHKPHDGDLMMPGMAVDKLFARGVQVTCCNVALTVLSGLLSKNAGVTPEVAKKEWVAGLIPGVVLVPSGVLAVNRAQEKGCTYCSAG
ncbi:MAG: hypothetical protein ABI969_02700 [bacterium]